MTSSTVIPISTETHALLKDLARSQGTTIQDLVDQAVELYRRHEVLQTANEAYAALRTNSAAWESYRHELAEWDATLGDGIIDY